MPKQTQNSDCKRLEGRGMDIEGVWIMSGQHSGATIVLNHCALFYEQTEERSTQAPVTLSKMENVGYPDLPLHMH